ncbi:secretory carrier-associated membrane protein 5 [Neodiprion pinetum]|uniref:Secretory carrier-associated membrane protein n=1 Tax=Neodiprion lecontei TaxID=441921 RepID=A0A6J0BGQ2_NEOLC|nr:secretory carrier-associated membrane protein 5 [Neodiprion lecontei]XP_046431158.1 secretory carrier-associated membrane protein 5 [Neodiprion fabricii]XP_046431159.1 secretory carrier-associated membrane protein 5 [Neodiprion fabricii]XP_046488722.1 secretory carrier-associated membrane protein 5 [Neodiprion pinetum]XP_046488725.1 secretory carrier-associated membrane protein 5 [Neodiprion pinetum]XP_046599721.1 secretory carrier-associated membrane protein 5 [Neodiprion lecontei]XP_0466
MSGFDENPFGEPALNDPFSDPAVRQAASSTPANRGIEDYNPFADQGSQGATQVRGASNPPIYGGVGATQQPATLQPTNQEVPPPNYTRSAQQTVTPTPAVTSPPAPDRRQEDEWKARRDEEMRNTPYYARRNNWPPLPEKCCFQPCVYQDIDVDIPADFQKIVRQLYYLWMFHGCVMVLNVVGGFALLLYGQGFSTFGLAILYLLLFTPFSFLCWYRPAYKAFRSDSSFNFMVFFFVFFFQFVVTVIQALGISGSGTCGIIIAIEAFDGTGLGVFIGILLLIIAIGYAVAAVGDILLLSKIHRIYRSTGASVAKAQQEFTSTFLRNEHVQNAAGNVAASAVRSQMANSNQPRY